MQHPASPAVALRLRQWREDDRSPFAALNADPVVMEFFAAPQGRESSDASIADANRLARLQSCRVALG